MGALMRSLWDDESGQALVEYGLVVGLLVVGALAAYTLFGQELGAMFTRLTARVRGIG